MRVLVCVCVHSCMRSLVNDEKGPLLILSKIFSDSHYMYIYGNVFIHYILYNEMSYTFWHTGECI